ncbi:Transport of quorum-sensing signal protein [Luteitalea pratensis]|uniref:Transport of quorum-sensing signal protein n=1 Tax=Luteitalea pratensis TaxID=1855912 RepID=A0A143PWE0_LUTPR|nr:AI-2E family transporter [Luteitalea pratensis]AMY12370.1 Transport of quorum-sensing signal protein [Luteitalea pratensis]
MESADLHSIPDSPGMPDVADVRPGGSADLARDEVLPTLSIPTSVRSVALTVLTVIAVTWALYAAQTLFIPLLVGIVISLVLSPVVEVLHRAHVPRPAGATVVIALLIAAIGGIGSQLSAPAADLADDLPRVARQVRQALMRTTVVRESPITNLQEAAEELTTAASAAPRDRSGAQPVRMVEPPTPLRYYVITGTGMAAQVLLVLFLVFFLLSAGDLYKRKFVKLAGPSLSRKKITVQIIDEVREQIGVYLRTLVLVSAIVGIVTWLAYLAVGMPNATVWGLLAAVANVVPYIGPTLVSGAASVMAFSQFGTVGQALLVGGIQIVITSLEGFVLTPHLMSRSARMNPVAMFVGLLFWGWLWGAWGVVLGVPLLMAIKVIADRVEDLQGVGELLGD